jgi:hypothetical protein
MKDANLALRFLIEVTALVIFAYWGWKTGNGAMRWAVAIGAVAASRCLGALRLRGPGDCNPAIAAVCDRACRVGSSGRRALRDAVGHARPAVAFVGVAVASGVLNYVWE